MTELDTCKYCHFEYIDEYTPFKDDDWDILGLDDEEEWTHIQIKDRLYYKGIKCWSADMWFDNNMAIIVNPDKGVDAVARALGLHKDVIYHDTENNLMILNLFEEKYLRGVLDD